MGSFGERLQREREMRGITLDEISEATKIGTRSLRALEEQDFDQLPGGIFNKGFVRAYSRYLGLDEEQAVADYLSALNEAVAAGKATRQESTANNSTPERNLFIPDVEDREPMRLPLGPIAVLAVILVLLFAGWKYYAKHGFPKLRRARVTSQAARPAMPPPATVVTTVSPVVANALPASAPGEFVVRVRAKQDSWVSIQADGREYMSGTLSAPSEKSVHAQNSVVVKAGNAGAIELFYNDKLVPPPGGAGPVETLEFTAAGLRQ